MNLKSFLIGLIILLSSLLLIAQEKVSYNIKDITSEGIVYAVNIEGTNNVGAVSLEMTYPADVEITKIVKPAALQTDGWAANPKYKPGVLRLGWYKVKSTFKKGTIALITIKGLAALRFNAKNCELADPLCNILTAQYLNYAASKNTTK